MSTTDEKLQAIKHAMEQTKKRIQTLETIKSVSKLHKSQQYELDMCHDMMKRGEQLLKDYGQWPF